MLPLIVSLFAGFIPMFFFASIVYWMDRFEKEPRLYLCIVFSWGAIVAAGGAFVINSALGAGVYLFTSSEGVANLATGSLIAPIVEEFLKGLAVLSVFFVAHEEFDSILDGIVYAAITALGFAASENVFYIYNYGYLQDGWTGIANLSFIRIFLVGWQHPFYSAFFGIGLAISRLSKDQVVQLLSPLVGWGIGVFAHSIHNTIPELFSSAAGLLVVTTYDWIGWLFMIVFILVMTHYESTLINKHLEPELAAGNITKTQYLIAASAWSQTFLRIRSFFNKNYRDTERFYQVCAELAHKQEQTVKVGEEKNNSRIINHLREEMIALSSRTI